jgi:DNA-binding response OmpR family regulator
MSVILLIDDEPDVREMIRLTLARNNYTVIEASTGKEGIARFKPSMVDLVITDILMPDEDGLEVIMNLKKLKPEVKIIAISGGGKAGPVNYLSLARALGADAALTKPFSIKELLSKISELIG